MPIRDRLEREWRAVNSRDLAILLIALVLVAYFVWGKNALMKLVVGGIFLILHGCSLASTNRISAGFEIFAGIMAVITAALPKQPLWYLVIFYTLILGVLCGFLYLYRLTNAAARRHRFEWIYRLTVIISASYFAILVILMMKGAIPFAFQIPMQLTDYIFLIQLSFISLITFFIFADNLLLLVPTNVRKTIISQDHSAYHSFFLSLCLTILIGGYYYINSTDNLVLQKILLVLGAAFFTSLVITDALKNVITK